MALTFYRGQMSALSTEQYRVGPGSVNISSKVMEHSTALPPLPTWTRHLNLSREELESLLTRLHSKPVISVLRAQGEQAESRGDDGLNSVILVGSGLFILLLLLILIKYKPEERLNR